MAHEEPALDKPEDLQESAWALFEKSARLRKEADGMALRAHDLLEQARKLKQEKKRENVK